jgi:hypothetical protein
LTVDTDNLGAPGTLYRVKISAVNEEGMSSDFSNEFLFKLGSLPSKPAQVNKNDAESSGESIYLEWDMITEDTLPVLGYKLYANTGRNEPLTMVF